MHEEIISRYYLRHFLYACIFELLPFSAYRHRVDNAYVSVKFLKLTTQKDGKYFHNTLTGLQIEFTALKEIHC